MPINGVREIDGLTHNQANDGIPVSSIPVISGAGGPVTDFSVIWTGLGLPPLDALIGLQGFPYPGAGAIATGTDSLGQIGVVKTFTGTENDTSFLTSAGLVTLTDGFWAGLIRMLISDSSGTRKFNISYVALDVNDASDFSGGSPPTDPTNLDDSNVTWDSVEEEGTVDLSWDVSAGEDGYVIIRDGLGVGTVPAGVNTFTDTVFAQGDYTYEIKAYTYGPGYVGNSLSGASNSVIVSFSGVLPDISITGSGGIDFGGSAELVFIQDPSGIYTLVPGKTHDTLYERLPAITEIDVAIPRPFGKLGYIP